MDFKYLLLLSCISLVFAENWDIDLYIPQHDEYRALVGNITKFRLTLDIEDDTCRRVYLYDRNCYDGDWRTEPVNVNCTDLLDKIPGDHEWFTHHPLHCHRQYVATIRNCGDNVERFEIDFKTDDCWSRKKDCDDCTAYIVLMSLSIPLNILLIFIICSISITYCYYTRRYKLREIIP